jgi:hypothetical protein
MVLQAIGGGYDYVQDTAPTSPSIGDTWLDTSTDPPTGKVYADLGGGGQWTTNLLDTQVSSRSSHSDPDPNGHIDAPVSQAGASTDSLFGSNTKEVASAQVVQFSDQGPAQLVSVSGSGVLKAIHGYIESSSSVSATNIRLSIDGSQEFELDFNDGTGYHGHPLYSGYKDPLYYIPINQSFNSSFTIEVVPDSNTASASGGAIYGV